MSLRAEEVLAIANQYTDETVEGGGAIKGKNCTIDSIEPISGGQRVTFKWTLDDGTEQTTTMDVMNGVDGQDGADGQDGKGIKRVYINNEEHLIIVYTDDTETDAGAIEVQSAVDSVNGKTGEVTLTASDVGALPDDTTIPSKTSDLTNDSNFVADASYVHTDNNYDATAKNIVDGVTTALADKADKVASATNGNFAGLDANGNLIDSGKKASDFVTPSEMGRQLPLVNLGTEYTAELKADISLGKFEKAVVGGYLTINGHVYYLAHPDYWLHTGDTECTTHHMLVIPAEGIGTGKMNDSNITTGAYAGSDMKTGNNSNTALTDAKAQIIADFGAANILTHRELFTTAVTDGKASNWAWADSDVDLMNEVMVYGCNAWGSHPGYETGIDKCQLKLFQERPDLITTRSYWWLRGVVSAAIFAYVDTYGNASYCGASDALGVRPAFAIK